VFLAKLRVRVRVRIRIRVRVRVRVLCMNHVRQRTITMEPAD
jgi:hypothetical protein